MPIYEYNCQDCKQIFEEWQKDYEERDIPCPVCGGNACRIMSSSSFVLKGGGWYASGYSGGSPADSTAGSGAGSSAPAGADAKSAESAPAAPAAQGTATGS
ncbi:MAG: zinc ribbon domain-containing protein [Desulfovibrio sp.]|jgi:putative FmdB family regulatory protein|nr:zinc ribbon domain-containing protein [Desulfovibrio sp.]